MAELLKGAAVVAAMNEKLSAEVAELKAKGVNPTLAILRVGERDDDISYEKGAMKRCETVGVAVRNVVLPADVSQDELMKNVEALNDDKNVHGVLIFRPLPKHLDEEAVRKALKPEKDVDGITDGSLAGASLHGNPRLLQGGLQGQASRRHREKPRRGQACRHHADEQTRHRHRLPYENGGYAFGHPHR